MIGDIISAGSKLIGGFMGAREADKTRDAQIAMNERNIQKQEEFAREGISWRVADAKRAGIHPIYALGGQGASFSPVSANFSADTSMANAMAGAGQDIGSAINKTRTESQRIDAFTKTSQALQLENQSLQNEALRTEIASKAARLRQTQGPPMAGDPYLIPGQTQSGVTQSNIKEQPMERVIANPWMKHAEPGAITDVSHIRTSGGLYPAPSKDTKERIEDNFWHETAHFIRNNLLPSISPAFNDPPTVGLKPGHVWVYDPIYGYKQIRDTKTNRFFRHNIN